VGHMSRSSVLLRVQASLARVFQSDLKTGGGAATGGARGTIQRLHRRQVEDGRVDATGCVGPCYPTFLLFSKYYALGHSSHLVFYLILYI
jgi:hypothetical protein